MRAQTNSTQGITWRHVMPTLLAILFLLTGSVASAAPVFDVSFTAAANPGPLTGRIFVFISRNELPEVRLQTAQDQPQMCAVEASGLKSGQPVRLDDKTHCHPYLSLSDLPEGDYYVQAFAMVYVKYLRADGHVVWGLDQWNGQEFTKSPGSLYSKVQKVHLNPVKPGALNLVLTERIPPAREPADTQWLKHIKVKSELLSKFWGRPIYLGASVLLPRDYAKRTDLQYPIIYEQKSHYLRDEALGFAEKPVAESEADRRWREASGFETGVELLKSWSADKFPRMIVARIIHPTPYYDYSGVLNSPNTGPYQDAIMKELIPYIEQHFRVIRQPYARILVGKSSGGRDALALQLHYPEFFGGAWIFHPWAFDYRRYFGINIYDDKSAFLIEPSPGQFADIGETRPPWMSIARVFPYGVEGQPFYTMQGWSNYELVRAGHTFVNAELNGTDNALNSPVGDDGYPKQLYDLATGKIDRDVAQHWKQQGDLGYYLRTNWPSIGKDLVGKLHVSIGDADEWYRQYGVYDLQKFLEGTKEPYYAGSFVFGPRKGHGWQPTTNAVLVRTIADYIAANAPKDAVTPWKDQ